MPKYLTLATLTVAFVFGCTIDDDDRCPGGLYWDDIIKACRLVEEEPDGGPDAGDDGYLSACNSQEECAAYEADYCLYDPTKDDPGICVFQNCEAGTCPGESLCCDCTLFPVTLCLQEGVLSNPALDAACECTP